MLTVKEVKIVVLVLSGLSNKKIAKQLNNAEQTIKNHLSIIYLKLHIKNRKELVKFFDKPSRKKY